MLSSFEFRLGLLAIFFLGYADIFGLPASITAGHVALIFFLPFWLNAYLARAPIQVDSTTQLSVLVVLFAAGLLMVLSIVSAVYSPAPLRVGRAAIAMMAALAMFFLVFGTFTKDRALTSLNLLIVVMATVCVFTFFGWLHPGIHEIVYEEGQDRARGTFKNQNQFGIVLSCIMPISAAMIFVTKGRKRILNVLTLMLLCAGLALTGSKTNLVIAAFGFTIFFFVIAANTPNPKERMLRFVAVIVILSVCMAVAGAILYYLNPRTLVLAVEYWNDGSDARTIASRQLIWQQSFQIFADNPILGGGADEYWVTNYPEITHSHNALIEYARILGSAGLVLMLAVHLFVILLCTDTFFRCIFQSGETEDKAILLSLAIGSMSFLFANQMSDSFGATTAPFFWLVFFTLAFYRTAVYARPKRVRLHRNVMV